MATSNGNQELLGKTYSNYSSNFQSTIVLAGPLDLLTGSVAEKSREMPEKSNANRWLGKTVDQAPDLYRLASPLYRINESTPAIHFLLGNMMIPLEINLPVPNWLNSINAPRFRSIVSDSMAVGTRHPGFSQLLMMLLESSRPI